MLPTWTALPAFLFAYIGPFVFAYFAPSPFWRGAWCALGVSGFIRMLAPLFDMPDLWDFSQ